MKSMSGKEFAKLLKKKNWELKRIKGSHHVYVKSGNPARISVPIHKNMQAKFTGYIVRSLPDEGIRADFAIAKSGIINNLVGTGHALSSNKNTKNNNLSVIVRAFKSAVTKQNNRIKYNEFKWQRSFHDHIIHMTDSLNNIRAYVINSPATWNMDENNIKNYSLRGKACLATTGQF